MEHPHFKMIKNQSSRPYEIHLSFDKLLSYTSLIQDVTLRNKISLKQRSSRIFENKVFKDNVSSQRLR